MSAVAQRSSATFSSTLRAALTAGLVCGAAFGLVDAVVAWRMGTADLDFVSCLGCAAAAVFEYVLVWSAGLCIAAIVLRPWIARRGAATQALAFVRIALLLGIFLELYWWSRSYLFSGWNSLSPARIATTLVIALVSIVIAFALAKPLERLLRGSPRLIVALVLVVASAGAVFLAFHGASVGSRGEKNTRNERVPNVLLVVVDALRQDTLGCYGHARVKSPNIDRLAAEGVVFENAFTQAPFTLTSFGSFLTGKYPRRHGLVSMSPGKRMRRDNVTLPSHLKHACGEHAAESACLQPEDWLTASFHTGAISNGSGLLRGFDLYYEQMVGHGIVIADSAWSVFRSDLLLHLIADKTRAKLGNGVASVSRAWLEEVGDHRFMAMVHLYSTHTPYDPERRFREMYVDPAYQGPIRSFYATDRRKIEDEKLVPTAADVAQIQNLYYAGVSEADDRIGQLMDTLRAQGVLDDTLVVVLSDHGESLGEALGEDELWEHNHMVQTNLRIPLVMRWPKGIPAGTRVKALVDEIDLMPTVCDLLDIEGPPLNAADPLTKVDGVSTVPLFHAPAATVREYSFAENGIWISAQDLRWKLVVPYELLSPETWSKQVTEYLEAPWLVDLAADPHETRNVMADHPAEVERLLKALRDFDASMPIAKSEELSAIERAEQAKRLHGLGYTGDEGKHRRSAPPAK